MRLPFRHLGRPRKKAPVRALLHESTSTLEATTGFEPVMGVLQTPALTTWPRRRGAEDEIRTRDLLLGKETRYRCATSADYRPASGPPEADGESAEEEI